MNCGDWVTWKINFSSKRKAEKAIMFTSSKMHTAQTDWRRSDLRHASGRGTTTCHKIISIQHSTRKRKDLGSADVLTRLHSQFSASAPQNHNVKWVLDISTWPARQNIPAEVCSTVFQTRDWFAESTYINQQGWDRSSKLRSPIRSTDHLKSTDQILIQITDPFGSLTAV